MICVHVGQEKSLRSVMESRLIKITTPKKYLLDGLWLGPQKPKRVFICIHGLAGNVFTQQQTMAQLVDSNTAVLMFSNRGHDKVSRLVMLDSSKKGYHSIIAGEAHEVFTDCTDDIQGAVDIARSHNAKEIYLFGHSTGCQKAVYYLAKTKQQSKIAGAILLAPISDYASALYMEDKKTLARATAEAQKLVKQKKPHAILPLDIWPQYHDAQRFLSLYTPNSAEEIFSYGQPTKIPRAYQSVTVPVLTIFADNDEYADRPVEEMVEWFANHSRSERFNAMSIKQATHNFRDQESAVARAIKQWIV